MTHFQPLSPAPSPRRQPRWTALAAVLLAGPLAGAAQAATITISDNCSLVDAITAANSDTATGDCAAGAGADTIVIPPGRTTTLTVANNAGSADSFDSDRGLPVVTSTLRI
ncbi:MAG: hypothetical protein NTZ11_06915 [Gammaproteobacteria bacterium]|nr:hypothetical protein [Gammaproteobacteria bacterium]